MNASDRELTLWRQALTDLPPPPACPEPERIWGAARGELPAAEVSVLADHTLGCGDCAAAWQLAVELGGELEEATAATRFDPQETLPERPNVIRPLRWRTWGLAAAAAAAAVVLAVGWPPAPSLDPAAEGAAVVRQAGRSELASLLPDEPLPRDGARLAWTAVEGARHYELTVRDAATLEALVEAEVEAEVEATSYPLRAEDLSPVPAGGTLLWTVRAVLDDGRTVEASFSATVDAAASP